MSDSPGLVKTAIPTGALDGLVKTAIPAGALDGLVKTAIPAGILDGLVKTAIPAGALDGLVAQFRLLERLAAAIGPATTRASAGDGHDGLSAEYPVEGPRAWVRSLLPADPVARRTLRVLFVTWVCLVLVQHFLAHRQVVEDAATITWLIGIVAWVWRILE